MNECKFESETQRRIYETALNSTPDFVYVFGLDHRALYANEALLKVFCYMVRLIRTVA